MNYNFDPIAISQNKLKITQQKENNFERVSPDWQAWVIHQCKPNLFRSVGQWIGFPRWKGMIESGSPRPWRLNRFLESRLTLRHLKRPSSIQCPLFSSFLFLLTKLSTNQTSQPDIFCDLQRGRYSWISQRADITCNEKWNQGESYENN